MSANKVRAPLFVITISLFAVILSSVTIVKPSYLRRFLVPNFTAGHLPPSPGITHEAWVAISCSLAMKTTSKVVFITREQLSEVAIDDSAHTVLYCTVLYCYVMLCYLFSKNFSVTVGRLIKSNWAAVLTGSGL